MGHTVIDTGRDAHGGPITSAAPAQGQTVTVRGRQWVTSDVVRSTVASDDPTRAADTTAQHLVLLVSIEDDARDEELRVVWELEHGAIAHDRQVLPSPAGGFDAPERLDAFLDAVRWGAVASADHTALQAPFRSGIEIQPYQLDPVVRALGMPRTNLLIADDVGLGKTIEAGLVMQELILRHRARTMLIVCPANLTLQWRDEMLGKFGMEFRILDSTLLRRLRRDRGLYTNPWTHYPRLIVSVDWLKRERPRRMLREVLPDVPGYPRAFDLLLVDEVHTCAPSGTGRYAVDSQRTQAVRELARHCEHRLFLSATPHNGYPESFSALLELLDDQRFARGVPPSRQQLAQVMVRRLKSELPKKWDGTDYFPQRVLHSLTVEYGDDTRALHALLTEYAASRRTHGLGPGGRAAGDFVTSLLKKRFLSSPLAFANTAAKHLQTMKARSDGSMAREVEQAGVKVLKPLVDRLDESAEDDAAYDDAEEAALVAARRVGPALTDVETGLLTGIVERAARLKDRTDAKFDAFRAWLEPIVCPEGPTGAWTGERVIVFTEYRDTQRWLRERLSAAGVPDSRIHRLYGGQDEEEREHIKTVFQESPDLDDVRILLATDAASEGINLQARCHRLLHWEIPWNPNRMEQRNGRVDRHGQTAAQVDVLHFVPEGWRDATDAVDPESRFDAGTLEDEMHFLVVATRKVERIREDLGSASEVIAAQVQDKMLGRRTDWSTADVEITRRSPNRTLKVERDHARDIERLAGDLAGTRARLGLTPDAVERVVRIGLDLAHGRDLTSVRAPSGVRAPCFRLPELSGAWADARNQGLRHPLTGKERVVTFDHDAAAGRSDVVLLHLGHRLVQMCLRLLRAELWSGTAAIEAGVTGTAKLHRVTAKILPGGLLRTPAVVAHGRLVVTGNGGLRLHEEVLAAGGTIEQGGFIPARQADIETWLGAARAELPEPAMLDRLAALWPALEADLGKALNVHGGNRVRSMRALLAKRCDQEIDGIEKVLAELRRSIEDALADRNHWQQASLFEAAEQLQMSQDRQALTERLESIPRLVEAETAALRSRYADPTPRRFPAAVTFLVPSALARGDH